MLELNITARVDCGRSEEFSIKNLKTKMCIFWCCLGRSKQTFCFFNSTSGHFKWKSAVVVSVLGVDQRPNNLAFGSNNGSIQLSHSQSSNSIGL